MPVLLLLHGGGRSAREFFAKGREGSVKRAVYIAIASTCLC